MHAVWSQKLNCMCNSGTANELEQRSAPGADPHMDARPSRRLLSSSCFPHSHFRIMCSLQLNKAFAGNAIKLQRAVPAPWFYTEKALVSGGLAHPMYYKLDFLHLQAALPGTALPVLGLQLPDSHAHPLRQTDTPVQLPLSSSWHQHTKSTHSGAGGHQSPK